jgi:hypothetical protein
VGRGGVHLARSPWHAAHLVPLPSPVFLHQAGRWCFSGLSLTSTDSVSGWRATGTKWVDSGGGERTMNRRLKPLRRQALALEAHADDLTESFRTVF